MRTFTKIWPQWTPRSWLPGKAWTNRDPRFARVYASLADLRRTDKIGYDCDHIGIDDHQGAFEWREERKAEAIKVLVPALALLDELAGKRTSQVEGE